MNSFLEVDELKTAGFSDEAELNGVPSGTQLHDAHWNLSSLVHSAAILLLILLPQNSPFELGPELGPDGLPLELGLERGPDGLPLELGLWRL